MCHRCVVIYMCVCLHVNNPSLTVSHVVSLTVPTKTAPVGSNPFEDDEEEEEEEMAVEQQTTVNHISVNKEEIKTLVNRRKNTPPTHNYLAFPVFYLFFFSPSGSSSSMPRVVSRHFFIFVTLLPSSFVTLSSPSGGRLLCLLCMVTGMASHTKPTCVCPSLLTVPCLAEHQMSCALGAHVSAVGNPTCLTVRSEH